MSAALISVLIGGVHLGAAVIARHKAQAAADLAALAGATFVPSGPASACARASALALAMGTNAVECALDGLDVVVTVEAVPGLAVGRATPARAVARAGPAD